MPPAGLTPLRAATETSLLERMDLAAGRLANTVLPQMGEPADLLRNCTELLTEALACERCSIWRLNHSNTKFHCLDSFEKAHRAHSADLILPLVDHPVLFSSLETRTLEALRGQEQGPLAREFESYMDLHGITSLLLAPLKCPDHETGLILFERKGTPARPWLREEHHAAAILTSLCQRVLADKAHKVTRELDTEAREQLNQVIDFLPDPTFIIDKAGTVQAWNEAMELMTGIPKNLILGHGGQLHSIGFYGSPRPMLIDLVLQGDEETEKLYSSITRLGDTLTGEATVSGLNNGKGAILMGSARPLYDAVGNIRGAIETIHDVTKIKETERKARDWQRRYEMVSAASGQVTYEVDLDSGLVTWSNTSTFVLGVQLETRARTIAAWLDMVHPEDRVRVYQAHDKGETGEAPFAVEYRVRTDTGIFWFRDHAFITSNHEGKRCRMGMLVDITAARLAEERIRSANDELERRVAERTSELAIANQRLLDEIAQRARAQKALASSEEKYRSMVDALPQIVFELDLSGRILLLNRQGLELSGLSKEQLAEGPSIMEFIHPEDVGRLRESWSRIISGDTTAGSEYRFMGRDGRSFPATTYAQLVCRDGTPSFVTGFLIDETERIRAREALEKAHAELEARVEQRTSELAASNASMKALLARQEINIGLASRVLQLVNSTPARNTALPAGNNLFVAAHLLPRNKEGGDHFFSRTLGKGQNRRTLVSLKDESGHEVGCILRSIITDLFHNALLSDRDGEIPLTRVMAKLNQELCSSRLFADGEYLTAVTLEIEHASLRLRYVLAGHPPFLFIRGSQVTLLPGADRVGANLPLGMIEGANFQQGELQLQPGDRILLYTDGLLDLPMANGKQALTAAQLAAITQSLLGASGQVPITRLSRTLLTFLCSQLDKPAGERPALPDDLSVVVIEVEGPGKLTEHSLRAADVHDLSRQRAKLSRHLATELLREELHVEPGRLGMVLEEAIYNAWKHGNRQSPDADIRVRHCIGNDLHIEIEDEGQGFALEDIPDPTAPENRSKPSGRGLFIIRRFADEASWLDGGRRLSLRFATSPWFMPSHSQGTMPALPLWK